MPEKQRRMLGQLVGVVLISLLAQSMDAEPKTELPTGIEGTATISPVHGGPIKMGEPDSAPMKNVDFLVEAPGGKVVTFKTDDKGNFKLPLAPGRYSIRMQGPTMRGRECGLADVEVTASGYKKVTLNCDSGMR
jgi:hypothetical protein